MTANPAPIVVAAAALQRGDGAVLMQRRPDSGPMPNLWEFPGGKLEPGESGEDALVRELREELGIAVAPADLVPVSFSTGCLGERSLVILLYLCRAWHGEPRALHASALAWCAVEELAALPLPPADYPLIPALATVCAERSG